MAIHPSVAALLRESVPEYLDIARYCCHTPKPGGGWYGYPAALLLLTIIDVIGSYHWQDSAFTVNVDGRAQSINDDASDHYLVLNSHYYGQSLTRRQIDKLSEYFRCLLAHNASLAPGKLLDIGNPADPVFYFGGDGEIDVINLRGLLAVTEGAVQQFLAVADTVGTGRRAKMIMRKAPP